MVYNNLRLTLLVSSRLVSSRLVSYLVLSCLIHGGAGIVIVCSIRLVITVL